MKKVRENLYEAKLNLPKEYIDKVTSDARARYGQGPTQNDKREIGRLLHSIFPLQRGHEEELAELGINVIKKFYGPVIGGVEIDAKIVPPDDEEKLEMAQKMLQKQEQEDQQEEQEDNAPVNIDLPLKNIEHDIDKRKLINNIMQGEAQNVHDMMYDVRDQVKEITGSNQLLDYYMQFLALNKKFDWDDTKVLEDMIQHAPEWTNAMETEWEGGEEGEGDKPKIKARVLDLPMLIHEVVKGIYELIAAGAIDPDPVRAQKVLSATDSLTDEQEDIRFGPYIAKDLRDYVNKVADKVPGSSEIPNIREFVFGKMIEMPAKEFVELMTAILMNEDGPKDTITKFIKTIQEDFRRHKSEQVARSFEEEPEELPDGAEEFEDDEMIKMIRGSQKEEPKQEPSQEDNPQDFVKKLASMNMSELNLELNKAIDSEDWKTAQDIQKMIERRGGMSESVCDVYKELFEEVGVSDDELLENEVYHLLFSEYISPRIIKVMMDSDLFKRFKNEKKRGKEIANMLMDAMDDGYFDDQIGLTRPKFDDSLEHDGEYDEEFNPEETP